MRPRLRARAEVRLDDEAMLRASSGPLPVVGWLQWNCWAPKTKPLLMPAMKSLNRRSMGALLGREAREFMTIKPTNRPYQFPLAVAVAVGLPLLLGAWSGAMSLASLAAVGAMTIVYVPRTRLARRVATLLAIAFAMIVCHALGQFGQLVPLARVPIIGIVAAVSTLACRYFRVVPPGPLFFVMATAIGAYAPAQLEDMPLRLGIFALGAVGAVIVGFVYSAHILRSRAPQPVPPHPHDMVKQAADSLIIGAFVGLSLAVAQILSIEKPYWAPISCMAVIQGLSLRAIWLRQAERIVGTMLGLGLTWVLLVVAADAWSIAIAVIVLTFCIEAAIVRHYAFAAIFITPLTILLAEMAFLGDRTSSALMAARLADTVVGALAGLLGGVCLHSSALRRVLARCLSTGPSEHEG